MATLRLDGTPELEEPKPEGRPRCVACGRFGRAKRDREGQIIRDCDGDVAEWTFGCLWYDWEYGWEHD